MNQKLITGGASIAVLLCSACSAPELVGRPDLAIYENKPLPEPVREDLVIPPRPYVLGPSDNLNIDVFGIPELSKSVTVDLTGQIALPLVGQLQVSGLTTGELTSVLEKKLRQAHVLDPQVTVNIANAASQIFTVDGSVAKPGVFPLAGRMSLMRAIAQAAGTTEFARENYVVVFRTVEGKRYAALYDLRAIRQGMYDDPEIFSNDIVYVGDSQARRLFRDIITAAPLITTPLIILLR
ncbi:polysaccharide biosynthesis/export family protein [Novosphingobium album (ex Hu et al. 2023)]|uniref:Polysaccharide export protein n=1 Tax=Novosphingobium album (ex Hu et al. 2023) TaxID=2930093 RepID=A0ABT0B5X0_9SPHN|nr:polysaccharide biosynthesis/export family protein [Novosphingobium album (ex Hu et al. 2023)]MCJ2180445.1 polysaccharide export protein [Novosphingobium album (ex Hu et al. 2023)]